MATSLAQIKAITPRGALLWMRRRRHRASTLPKGHGYWPHARVTTKGTLAAFSALKHLDPTTTLTTGALLSGDECTLFDSEGDLLLGAGESEETEVSGRAGLQTADKTAAALTPLAVT